MIKIKNTQISFVKGDITQLTVDAIVNAANNKLEMGGGVAGAIKRKGGVSIETEALQKAPLEIGDAVATGAGMLPAKFVIHAATMGMDFKTDESKIRASCRSALRVAHELNLRSLALPALGCGVGGFPLKAAAKIMSQEAYRYARDSHSRLQEIIFCLFDQDAYDTFREQAEAYLQHIVEYLQWGPFTTVDAIIELSEGGTSDAQKIVVIERSNPPFGFALPGGFVDYGESLEDAARREAKEETGLEVTIVRQLHTYSAPERDPRFHTIGTVYLAKAKGTPHAGDDAAAVRVVSLREIESLEFAFDHKRIILDYGRFKKGVDPFV